MTQVTVAERIADVLCNELEDGMVVCTGVNSLVPLAASMLAQVTHAPNLTILAGGIFVNPGRLVPEFCAGWDLEPEYVADMSELYAVTEIGIDVVFFSGLQLDRYGNVNMHRVGGAGAGGRRGPGVANTSFGHTARKVLLWTERHEARQLRQDVDFCSIVGHNLRGVSRADLGLGNLGPQILVTPEVVFRPSEEGILTPKFRLGSEEWTKVAAETGWSLPAKSPAQMAPMDKDRLEYLRRLVDPGGLLQRSTH
jgi:glutaconate CoA-transferase, subunit B